MLSVVILIASWMAWHISTDLRSMPAVIYDSTRVKHAIGKCNSEQMQTMH